MATALVAAVSLANSTSYGIEWSNAPGVRLNPGNLTSARWIWHSGPVLRGGNSYFRFSFDVPGEIEEAFVNLAMDDHGEWYLNGKLQKGKSAGKCDITPGRNVIAAHVKNYSGVAGLLVFGEVRLKNSRRVLLRSDGVFKAAAKADAGWERADFDDSRWKAARSIADASGEPFSISRDYLGDFATDDERAAVARWRESNPLRLPEGLERESDPKVRIVYDGAIPKIEVNGRMIEPDFNSTGMGHDYAVNIAAKLSDMGWRINQVSLGPRSYEKAPGEYDFSALERMALRALTSCPDSYLVFNIEISIPKWTRAHPESWVGYGDGKPGDDGGNDDLENRVVRPSAASREFRAEKSRMIAKFCEYVRSKPWAKRVIAVRPCWGVYWEWHVYGFYHSPDTGAAMTEAFRRWKGGKYADQLPPTPSERTRNAELLDPVKDAKIIDYYDCLQTTVVDLLKETAGELKRGLPGRLVGAYYGYVLTTHPPEGANVMLDEVLSSPDIDFLSDPSIYTGGSRRAGGAYYHRTLTSTFHRYGKMSLIEDDMRHHHVMEYAVKSICAATPRESRMVMRRNYLNRIFDGCGIQVFDPGGLSGGGTRPSTHDDPEVLAGLREAMDVTRRAGRTDSDTGNTTAVVYDWRQCLRMDNNAHRHTGFHRVYTFGPEMMFKSGMVFDMISLDDYLAAEKAYDKVIFAAVFTPDPAMAVAAAAKLERDRARAARLCLAGSPKGVLGGRVKDVDALPAAVQEWAALFSSLGAERVSDVGNYVRRRGGLVLFHTARAAKHRLRLPEEGSYVELFSNRDYDGREFDIDTDGPDTLLFKKK